MLEKYSNNFLELTENDLNAVNGGIAINMVFSIIASVLTIVYRFCSAVYDLGVAHGQRDAYAQMR